MFGDLSFGGGGGKDARLKRVELMLEAIITHLDIPFNERELTTKRASDEVRALVKQGKKLEAIKVYRQQTGASLEDAKRVIAILASA